jgi:hypothetical protein
MKGVRAAAAAAALAAVAAVVFAWPAGAETPDESRSITVSGFGSVTAVPDQAEWSFGVQTEGATAREALRKNANEIAAVIQALKDAGIAAADLRTEQVSVFPRTSPDGSEVLGYTASNSVHVVLRDIAKAGAVIDVAAAAGANQIFGPMLTVSNSDALYEKALEEAYDQATARASRLAAKAGVQLGRVQSIVEGSNLPPTPVFRAGGDSSEAAATPIEPGTTEVQATITVTFAIS